MGLAAGSPAGGAARALRWLAPLAILLLVGAAFLPALEAELVSFDDPGTLTQNPDFRGLGTEQLGWMVRTGHMGHYQPLSWLTLAVDYVRGGHGARGVLDPAPFHATNLVLHALAALAVWALARRLFALAGKGDSWTALAGSLAAALLFAVHPLRVESVAWVTERRDVLSAPLFLLAAWCWLRRGREAPAELLGLRPLLGAALAAAAALALFLGSVSLARPNVLGLGPLGLVGLAGALAAWLLSAGFVARAAPRGSRLWPLLAAVLLLVSLLAKAWGIVMPALLLLLDAWPLRRTRGALSAARAWARLALEKAPFVALALAFALLARWAQKSQVDTMKSLVDHGLVERATQGLYGLAFYVARSLWPARLSPIYDLPQQLSLAQPRFLVPALAVVALTGILLARRRRAAAPLAAWIAYVVIVSPVLGVLQSGPQLVADRYSYLATVPLALLAGAALERGLARATWRPVFLAASTAAIVALTLATRAQARVWHDSRSLWEHALAVDSHSPLALLSMGFVRQEEAGRTQDPARKSALLDEAMELFERGLALGPQPRFLANMALVEGMRAELDPAQAPRHRAQALAYSARSLELARERGPVDIELLSNHGVHLFNAGRVQEALPIFEQYAGLRPRSAQAQLRYGMALLAVDRPGRAAQCFERALELEPWDDTARQMLVHARERQRGEDRAPR